MDKRLDDFIAAQKRVNGFDIRYNTNLDAEEEAWRHYTKALSQRIHVSMLRNGD